MSQRNAFTLLELVVSLASSMVLVAGLAGSLYISNQAVSGSSRARQSLAASTVLREMMTDLGEAKSISERTPNAITMTVPDRNGDLAHEVVRYAWSGTPGDPLTYQYNGGPIVNIATDVRAFNLTALTRELTIASVPAPIAGNVVYEGMAPAKSTSATFLNIAKPTNTSEGDLLIGCVVTKGNTTLLDPSGWTRRHVGWGRTTSTGTPVITFGVWWKIANASESGSYNFTWTPTSPSRHTYGWIMRFTGHNPDPAKTINISAIQQGTSTSSAPPSPAVTPNVPNVMILRVGGFDANRITVNSPGLTAPSPHTSITMDYSSNSPAGCSGGAGFLPLSTAVDSGTSAFSFTSGSEEYVTVTIAIAPKPAE